MLRFSFILLLFALAGCTTSRTSDTSRTAIEQLLVSNAVDQSLEKLALPDVAGRKVFVETQYLDSVDKGYVIASIRQRLLTSGALLTADKTESEIIVEVCSGGIGTDNVDSFLGVPGFALAAPIPVAIPELRLYQRKIQYGTAKISVYAYATADGRMLFDSGHAIARSDDNTWTFMGIGPVRHGSVRDEVREGEKSKVSLPTRIAEIPEPPITTRYNR
ncbi:MAG: hypothetical protein KF851_13465 [Pirellulaceae bacterium]|nr:hypothetical protein [Pirellulaceae bacterium]